MHWLKCHGSINITINSISVKSPFVRIGAFCSFVCKYVRKKKLCVIALSVLYYLKIFIGNETGLQAECVNLLIQL